jgi:hypothetical protein
MVWALPLFCSLRSCKFCRFSASTSAPCLRAQESQDSRSDSARKTLVHDVINGFFILMEDHFDIGDVIRTAGVKGTVEQMSLRRTVLRDDDGTVHIIPNSQITLVSNMTRDWSQVALKVSVAYDQPSDRIISLLQKIGEVCVTIRSSKVTSSVMCRCPASTA